MSDIPKYKAQAYKSKNEDDGLLKIFKHGKQIPGAKWKFRSGQSGYQDSYWITAKSPVPPSTDIQGTYALQPGCKIDSPAMGKRFFPIITIIGGKVNESILQKNSKGIRTLVGLHEDANKNQGAPGTAGCIGITPEDWPACQKMMDAIFAQELAVDPNYVMPLEVIYGSVSAFQDPKPTAPQDAQKTPFEIALDFTLKWEGGLSDNSADYGGRTYRGITQGTYNEWRQQNNYPLQDVAKMTEAEWKSIYLAYYWNASKSDKMCKPLAIVNFDTAVNFGVAGAGEFLQEAIGFTGQDVDGKVGPITLAKLKNGQDNKATALKIIEGRINWRKKIVAKDPTQKVFLQGWLNRDNDLNKLITNLDQGVKSMFGMNGENIMKTIIGATKAAEKPEAKGPEKLEVATGIVREEMPGLSEDKIIEGISLVVKCLNFFGVFKH